jgi:hypothetical protein
LLHLSEFPLFGGDLALPFVRKRIKSVNSPFPFKD